MVTGREGGGRTCCWAVAGPPGQAQPHSPGPALWLLPAPPMAQGTVWLEASLRLDGCLEAGLLREGDLAGRDPHGHTGWKPGVESVV